MSDAPDSQFQGIRTPTNMSEKSNHLCSNCKKSSSANTPDYYWRDYTGQIPQDAIPGGHDINRKTTYVGQAFHKFGIITANIYPEKAAVRLPIDGNGPLAEIGVKILCGRNENCFSWKEAKSSDLHLTTIGKHYLVIGGYEDGKIIYVGRAMYQGELIVGKVRGYEAEKAKLHFVYGEKEVNVSSYQILIYKETP